MGSKLPITDLENLSKEELIAIIKAMGIEEGKPYHPDSLMAMAVASPKEARAISWRMMHPFAKFMLFFGLGFVVFIFLGFILLVTI